MIMVDSGRILAVVLVSENLAVNALGTMPPKPEAALALRV